MGINVYLEGQMKFSEFKISDEKKKEKTNQLRIHAYEI